MQDLSKTSATPCKICGESGPGTYYMDSDGGLMCERCHSLPVTRSGYIRAYNPTKNKCAICGKEYYPLIGEEGNDRHMCPDCLYYFSNMTISIFPEDMKKMQDALNEIAHTDSKGEEREPCDIEDYTIFQYKGHWVIVKMYEDPQSIEWYIGEVGKPLDFNVSFIFSYHIIDFILDIVKL